MGKRPRVGCGFRCRRVGPLVLRCQLMLFNMIHRARSGISGDAVRKVVSATLGKVVVGHRRRDRGREEVWLAIRESRQGVSRPAGVSVVDVARLHRPTLVVLGREAELAVCYELWLCPPHTRNLYPVPQDRAGVCTNVDICESKASVRDIAYTCVVSGLVLGPIRSYQGHLQWGHSSTGHQ